MYRYTVLHARSIQYYLIFHFHQLLIRYFTYFALTLSIFCEFLQLMASISKDRTTKGRIACRAGIEN